MSSRKKISQPMQLLSSCVVADACLHSRQNGAIGWILWAKLQGVTLCLDILPSNRNQVRMRVSTITGPTPSIASIEGGLKVNLKPPLEPPLKAPLKVLALDLNVTRVQSATEWTASVHTLHMVKPVMYPVFKMLRNVYCASGSPYGGA